MGPGTAEGLTCIKPTFGRVSLHGVIPLSYTRDHVGSMARTAMDAAILLQVIAQPDNNDPRTLGLPSPPNYVEAATAVGGDSPRLRWPMRIGVWPGYLSADQQRDNARELELRRALLVQLERLGAEIISEVRIPYQWEELTAEPLGGSTGDPTAFLHRAPQEGTSGISPTACPAS